MNSNNRCRGMFFKIPFILIAVFVKGAVVMFLWNTLIPDLFHGPQIQYIQALGLMILAKLLVGFGGGFGHRHCGHGHHGSHWKRHFWSKMSAEERLKLREEFRKRCEGKSSEESGA